MSKSCPVCTSQDTVQLDKRSGVPVLMNRLYDTARDARLAPRGPVSPRGCTHCGFVWNADFDSSLIVYDLNYDNDQTHSTIFADHLNMRARDVVAAVETSAPIDFLEIGCGQGQFIEEVAKAAGERLQNAEGFDPAWRGREGGGPSGSRIHACYYDSTTAGRLRGDPNVVATRHTIEHVPDPVGFLAAIRHALGSDARATIFVETPCVEWILRNEAMQDFFYEHCSLFTADSLAEALRRAGFHSASVAHVFAGQYLWARAQTHPDHDDSCQFQAGARVALKGIRDRFTAKWCEQLAQTSKQGKVAIWGAGAKGVNFAMMIDPRAEIFDHVVDINPAKQGKFLPGSGLPVLSPRAAAARGARTIYVMNPHYLGEIRTIAADAGIEASFVTIN